MKPHRLFLALSILILAVGCPKSEVDQQPAAEVTETTVTTATTETALTSTEPTPGAVTGKVIKEKSKIEFVAAKVTRDHKGGFRSFDGFIEYTGGQPSRIAFEIDTASVFTDAEKLTGHLKTPDFFDVAKYPKATFVSTSIEPASGGTTTHNVKGIFDLHGVQKEITIPVKVTVTKGGVRATSDFTINRQEWGISYTGAADDLIKDNVLIKLDLMFPPPPAA